jgi:hypothetical protein
MRIWDLKQAPSQTDIMWEDLNRNKTLSFLKTCCLLTLLFAITIGLLTPLMLANAGIGVFKDTGLFDDDFIA